MIEDIFKWERIRSIQREAPFLRERERFLLYMLNQGIGKPRVRTVASILLHVVRLMELDRLRPAGIVRNDQTRYQPRLGDLRFTFAVHRITSWIRNGANLNRMLPALAAYMGQAGLGATERYLSMTPERFRNNLDKLSPSRGRKSWRNDKELMCFLTSL